MQVPNFLELRGAKGTEKYIKANYSEFYQYLTDHYPSYLKFREKMYWYRYDINEHPVCSNCGKKVKFAGSKKGYYKYCSLKCSNSDITVLNKKQNSVIQKYGSVEGSYKARAEKTNQSLISKYGSVEEAYKIRMEKVKATNLKRYGVECLIGTDEFKEKTSQTLISKYGSVEEAYKIRMEKVKATNLERHGVECLMGTDEFKEKSKATNLKRYGVENVSNNPQVRSKVRKTTLEKYGAESIFQLDVYKDKIKKTNLERYGVEYPQQNDQISQKSNQTKKLKFLTSHPDVIDVEFGEETIYTCSCPYQDCNKCKELYYKCTPQTYHNRRYNDLVLCTILLPEQSQHSQGTSIELFIRNILDEYNIEYQTNCRNIISPMELDIYIPTHKLAIECNGIYWHSDKNKDNKYHISKYNACKDIDIQLLTFWEDQIIYNKDIVRSILLSKLGIFDKRIYARKCVVKDVTTKDCEEFLQQNHLQGSVRSSIRFGLYYGNELVSIMSFGKDRISLNSKSSNNQYELYRFCNKINTQVIGGASKLLHYFIHKYNPLKITSFASNDISNGDLYNRLGFVKTSESLSYWYVEQKSMKRYHRYKFRKHELIKLGYDANKTERQIVDDMGYLRIYDCGQTKYALEIK